jgi:antitoxin MazE
MYTSIQKWGNSRGIRIPKSLLDAMDIHENDRVELIQSNDTITIKKASSSKHKTLEERLQLFYGKPSDEIDRIDTDDIDWGKPEGNEIW